jgi:hypothetical protein
LSQKDRETQVALDKKDQEMQRLLAENDDLKLRSESRFKEIEARLQQSEALRLSESELHTKKIETQVNEAEARQRESEKAFLASLEQKDKDIAQLKQELTIAMQHKSEIIKQIDA